MSKGGSKAPAPPDPNVVAGATTGSNINTAAANAALKNVNQYTPYGSTTYDVTGSQNIGGFNVPTYSQTTSLSPEQQKLLQGTQDIGQQILSGPAKNLTNQIGTASTNPLNFSGVNQDYLNKGPQQFSTDAANANYNLQKGFLDPQWTQTQTNLTDQLSRQGIPVGSDAYNNAMTNFNNSKTQAYQAAQNTATGTGADAASKMFGMALQGQQQNVNQQQLAQMNPIQLLGALYNGAGVGA